VAAERPIPLWLANSALIAGAVVLLSMSVSVLAAYSLSRFHVRGGHSLGLAILTAKMLPATLLVIPLFGIFRTLNLIGSVWSVILAHSTLVVPFSTWMLKGYFDTVPREIEQAAMIDGCSPLGALFRVVLPISAPGLAATALYGFTLSWSDYVYARTFLTNAQSNWTVILGITTMKGEYISGWNEISAAAILAALPLLLIYLFLQRYLVGGLTAGAVK
jgi:multiple sugar transport system permease protein